MIVTAETHISVAVNAPRGLSMVRGIIYYLIS